LPAAPATRSSWAASRRTTTSRPASSRPPRRFSRSTGTALASDYAALHIEKTKQALSSSSGSRRRPRRSAGRINSTGVTGTCAITISAGSAGYLEEVDASVTVVNGGTIGTNGITFNLSLDGGRTTKLVRLGTATSYTVPYVGIVINFGAGTLIAGDTYTFTTTAPMWGSSALSDARAALAGQQRLARSWVVIGDLSNSTFAGYVTTAVNAYETSNDRYTYARASVRDRLPLAEMSRVTKRMSGSPTLTFLEVGATGDTITRSAGSWITDGFAVGDTITVAGSASNNVTGAIASLSATVITLGTTDLANEGPVSDCTVTASPTLTFAEVGATGDTVTRSSGSWLNDGFAVGDTVTFAGTASNNVSGAIASLSATVLTFGTTDLAAEAIRSDSVTCTKGETVAAYVTAMASAFASVDAQKRIDLSLGRASVLSPITGWSFRRPAAWAASVREYGHDLQIPCWRKADGPLDGWDMTDGAGQVVEFDERTDGGALDGRFTCLRTWSNGPNGAFVALSLTRATEGSLLSRTHNMAVANLACTVTQAETEHAIGQVLVLNSDGTGDVASLQKIEERVNTALQKELLQAKPEGPRASKAVWSASRTDVLNTPGAELTGTLVLLLNGTIERVTTVASTPPDFTAPAADLRR
jgi:hypothetical protein